MGFFYQMAKTCVVLKWVWNSFLDPHIVRISILTMVKYIVYLSLSQPHKMMGSRRKYCAGRKDSPRGNPKAKRSCLGKGSVELAKLVIQRQ